LLLPGPVIKVVTPDFIASLKATSKGLTPSIALRFGVMGLEVSLLSYPSFPVHSSKIPI